MPAAFCSVLRRIFWKPKARCELSSFRMLKGIKRWAALQLWWTVCAQGWARRAPRDGFTACPLRVQGSSAPTQKFPLSRVESKTLGCVLGSIDWEVFVLASLPPRWLGHAVNTSLYARRCPSLGIDGPSHRGGSAAVGRVQQSMLSLHLRFCLCSWEQKHGS